MFLLHKNNNIHFSNIKQLPTEEYFQIIREQLTLSGKATVRITGTSMKPFLTPIRDVVEIIPPDSSLKRGDIVLFDTHYGRYILHRITRLSNQNFDMRGDNTIHGEKNLPKDFIVGIVSCAVRNGRLIKRESFIFKIYSIISPIYYTGKTIRHKILIPTKHKIRQLFY